ncbi:MAG: quinoprotein glucose dehydrogenase [Acidimicrobiia bacterium]|nr:quinoprotein glucose dehydrogenase [Acidimicrobiia bacterium]
MTNRLTSWTLLFTLAALGTALAGAQAPHPQNPRNHHNPGPEHFTKRVVATALGNPWEITWGPDGFLWVTERSAFRVTRVNPANGTKRVALALEGVYQSSDQEGLLGMALHPDLLKGRGRDYVYLAYTHDIDPGDAVTRNLRIRRYTYDRASQTLTSPIDVLDGLPAHDDHGGGRLLFGPDAKLYVSRGDQGANWLANYCNPTRSQDLPTADEVTARDWSTYQGKILRINLDGSIPDDNPVLQGVRSHILSYGHRNPQGMVFNAEGRLYAAEHGPSSDDELNLIAAGQNYGWPLVAGYRDDRSYAYQNWSASSPEPCRTLQFDAITSPPPVPVTKESEWHEPFVPPLVTFFTVPAGYDIRAARAATIAPAGIDLYTSPAIPGWANSVLITGMRTGAVYRVKLSRDGTSVDGAPLEYFKLSNRFRDLAISPDGRHIYVSTDDHGVTMGDKGETVNVLADPGVILEFTFTRQ